MLTVSISAIGFSGLRGIGDGPSYSRNVYCGQMNQYFRYFWGEMDTVCTGPKKKRIIQILTSNKSKSQGLSWYEVVSVPLAKTAQPDPVEIQRQQEAMQRAAVRKGTKFQRMNSGNLAERKHVDVQTELYLEELSDHIEDASVECQTDAFLDKPAKTQRHRLKMERRDNFLFDFDLEVEPVLQVLVGKTIEQALLEVLEEEELAGLRAQQLAFQELRNAELVEVQRLEEQERRHKEEKARRIKQQRMVLKKERETAEKIATRTFTQQYLADLLPSVYSKLRDNGYFYDPVQRDIETGFLPWLVAEVNNTLEKQQALNVTNSQTNQQSLS
ncbi:radial spoke head protein 3 homolog [Tachysurus vachellii]|uniref:radial spoke head protein 3 homolog n=1 Tax=Tachysurus vachellii TaxID=175792 RepID=UPI00296AA0E0|nr:radial spoke head protein 3 homolog [Tachysurus vachellii]